MAGNAQGASAPVKTLRNFSRSPDDFALFRASQDIPTSDVLEAASCYLSVALDSAYLAAENPRREAGYAVAYLIEMAKAAIDSIDQSAKEIGSSWRDDALLSNVFERLYALHENGVLIINPQVCSIESDDASGFLVWVKQQVKGGAQ